MNKRKAELKVVLMADETIVAESNSAIFWSNCLKSIIEMGNEIDLKKDDIPEPSDSEEGV